MKRHVLGAVLVAIFLASACTVVVYSFTSTQSSVSVPKSSPAAASPVASRSIVPQTPNPNISDPWAVVSAYYADVESGDYPAAWSLLSDGAATGQTSYQQFVAGYSCTGTQVLTENWESGDQVSFNLAATDKCRNLVQQYSGVDTVTGGKIVAANVTQDEG